MMCPHDTRTGLVFVVEEVIRAAMKMAAAEDAVGTACGKFLAERGRRERRFAAVDNASGQKIMKGKGVAVTPLRIYVADEAAGRKFEQGAAMQTKHRMASVGVASVGAAARTAMGDVTVTEPLGGGAENMGWRGQLQTRSRRTMPRGRNGGRETAVVDETRDGR